MLVSADWVGVKRLKNWDNMAVVLTFWDDDNDPKYQQRISWNKFELQHYNTDDGTVDLFTCATSDDDTILITASDGFVIESKTCPSTTVLEDCHLVH